MEAEAEVAVVMEEEEEVGRGGVGWGGFTDLALERSVWGEQLADLAAPLCLKVCVSVKRWSHTDKLVW